jgi:hypothetical protein
VDPGRLRDLLSAMAAERAFPQGGEGSVALRHQSEKPARPHKEVQPCWF